MTDLIIKKEFAEIREIKEGEGEGEGLLRIWCNMYPDYYNLQIRATNPIAGRYSNGKKRHMIATVGVSIEELENILAEMKAYRDSKKSIFDREVK